MNEKETEDKKDLDYENKKLNLQIKNDVVNIALFIILALFLLFIVR